MENEQHEIRDFFENFRDFFQFRGFIKISAIFTVFRDLSAISGDFRDSAEAAVDPGPWGGGSIQLFSIIYSYMQAHYKLLRQNQIDTLYKFVQSALKYGAARHKHWLIYIKVQRKNSL